MSHQRPVSRVSSTRRRLSAACLTIVLPLLACNALPGGLGNILGLLGGGLGGGGGGGLFGGPASTAYTFILSLIQNFQPPPNFIESDFVTSPFPTAENKWIVTENSPTPIAPVALALLDPAANYAAFGPDGRLYYTEEDTGRVRAFDLATETVAAGSILDLAVNTSGPRGLKGIAFSTIGDRMYVTYDASSTAGDSAAESEALESRLSSFPFAGGMVSGPETVFFATAPRDAAIPSDLNGIGQCIVAPDGFLYVAHGDRNSRLSVVDLAANNASGRILRFNQDGAIGTGNPNPASPGFAAGFRYPSAMGVDPDNGLFWVMETGSTVGDEVNLLAAGRYYGWPIVQGYSDTNFEEDFNDLIELVNQHPVIDFAYEKLDPRGVVVVRGGAYGAALEGNIFVGQSSVVPSLIHRFGITGDFFIPRSVVCTLPVEAGRVRDLVRAADGRIYALCQNQLLRLDPS